jgi:hypothetical protein
MKNAINWFEIPVKNFAETIFAQEHILASLVLLEIK